MLALAVATVCVHGMLGNEHPGLTHVLTSEPPPLTHRHSFEESCNCSKNSTETWKKMTSKPEFEVGLT